MGLENFHENLEKFTFFSNFFMKIFKPQLTSEIFWDRPTTQKKKVCVVGVSQIFQAQGA
jgi:hypothetical protein